eukprot:CAMPEP_0197182256 /NCGR_PEP_ID=MMETSP1423-20130617/6273_1 /TAXON_ID=476441 /ORGANISM="Pseudo-nitzschia heimii, Strain UNC1101" /LENGTH=159 /DNA_ID=CAMNT_0042632649 /DNA_START=222 /DNA_END=702 /DNA_ORIENTATION=+
MIVAACALEIGVVAFEVIVVSRVARFARHGRGSGTEGFRGDPRRRNRRSCLNPTRGFEVHISEVGAGPAVVVARGILVTAPAPAAVDVRVGAAVEILDRRRAKMGYRYDAGLAEENAVIASSGAEDAPIEGVALVRHFAAKASIERGWIVAGCGGWVVE